MPKKKAARTTKKKTASRRTTPRKKTKAKKAAKKAATSKKPTKRASGTTSVKKDKPPATKQSPAPPVAVDGAPGFPIVGMGASAGGLEALEAFFKAMPADAGIAFVVVLHLDPTHVSILPELLQKRTKMVVSQVKDGMKVEPNHVYVIPPNKDLTVLHGTLHLMELTQPRGANLPIDTFFRSLAQDQGRNAVCVILSGTGTDGTLGVKAIKAELGMVMVQDEESAKYEGMPRSAIGTGLADYTLRPEKMPGQLVKYTKHTTGQVAGHIVPAEGPVPSALQKIFVILRTRTDHDFSLYKKNTICRRIERRMNVHQIDDIATYVRYLRESDREVGILFKELLIGVTNFFRDPEAFGALQTRALPKLLAGKPDDYTIRVWVPGCATGEEAYSLGIVLHECMEEIGRHFHVQIFGTDIDEDAINAARAGIYPESILADVGPERLKRFFLKEEDGQYRVKKSIRDMLVFAPQNIIKDPPFTKLDLLSCRNLLIYLGPELQKKLLPVFHYSLRPDGLLFLGSSETVGQATDLFAMSHKKWKIFRRKPSSAAQTLLDFPAAPGEFQDHELAIPETVKKAEELSVLQLVETILREIDTPPCAIVNDACDVVYIHGRTGKFLEPAEGKVSVNVLEMARPGLRSELAAALRQVGTHKQEVTYRGLQIPYNGGQIHVDLTVKPILEQSTVRGLVMVVFEEVAKPTKAEARKPPRAAVPRKGKAVEELEQDLHYTRESLQTTIEELETSNEELKSTNEELQSTNEELQSTNEELETSKEELQSLNEESATVNAELQSRIDELSKANDDIKNLLDSTEIATIFLDAELCIRRFTPRAAELLPVTAADYGRPVSHFTVNLVDIDLASVSELVLRDLATREAEVQGKAGSTYRMCVRPYRTVSNVIDGVVITFENITHLLKRVEDGLRRLAAVVRDSNDAITLQDRHGKIIAWNRGAEQMYGFTESEALQMNIDHLIPEALREKTRRLMTSIFRGQKIRSLETKRMTKKGKTLDVWLTVTVLKDERAEPEFLATTERDITGLRKPLE